VLRVSRWTWRKTTRTEKATAAKNVPKGKNCRRLLSVSRPHSATCIAGHDAPLIGARAAVRGRSARKVAVSTDVVKRRDPLAFSSANRIERRVPSPAGNRSTD